MGRSPKEGYEQSLGFRFWGLGFSVEDILKWPGLSRRVCVSREPGLS